MLKNNNVAVAVNLNFRRLPKISFIVKSTSTPLITLKYWWTCTLSTVLGVSKEFVRRRSIPESQLSSSSCRSGQVRTQSIFRDNLFIVPQQRTTLTTTERSRRNSEDKKSTYTNEKLLFLYSKEIVYENARFEEIRYSSSHFDEDVICNENVSRCNFLARFPLTRLQSSGFSTKEYTSQ